MPNFYPPGLKSEKKILAIDFDGVLHNATLGWGDGTCYGELIPGSKEAIIKLSKDYILILFTAKVKSDRPLVNDKTGLELVQEWLEKYELLQYFSSITSEKPRADLYIDDNAYRFMNWGDTLQFINNEFRLNVFKKASLIRNFEEELFQLIQKGIFKYPIYLSAGQEFIPATIAELFKDRNPLLFAQHRAHGVYLAFGGNVESLIDELLGKKEGCANGMGGSASIQSKSIKMYGHDGLMGSQVPIAVGACHASNEFTISIMGDAAAEEDYVMSSIAWAGTKKLPILFIVEDNNLSILTEKIVRRSWDMDKFAKSVNVIGIDIQDSPIEIKEVLVGKEFPLLLNIHTDRLFWHANAGIDPYQKRDRYELELNELGDSAIQIHNETKKFIQDLWKTKLL